MGDKTHASRKTLIKLKASTESISMSDINDIENGK